ncbi:hypothetical protein QEN71_21200 [Paraburkholderia sabiae]|uniref:hypothetical protein n=1 Tax=Paraburkholderia sabiae TaxID=273251 RepID=UPI0025B774A0|nr:hypothetical protein [Paraburkholderia sabiae]WJZ72667.1 hypothetical protein QEN71_21200 [Paraburkholderia sabiae]
MVAILPVHGAKPRVRNTAHAGCSKASARYNSLASRRWSRANDNHPTNPFEHSSGPPDTWPDG